MNASTPIVLLALLCLPAVAQDVVVLKSGESIACRLDELTDRIVNVTVSGSTEVPGSSARLTLPAEQVERIEFAFAPGEEEVFPQRASMSSAALKPWWDHHSAHLHRPRSRAAAWGVAYADALLREEAERGPDRALPVYDLVLARAWSPEDAAAAKRGRLRALMGKGDLATATEEARILARETEDPALLIEAEHLLAMADFQALRELEEEHPRWMDDDEVRPRRHELYHRTLDQFLKPHLFHATREEAAARGLLSAAELLLFGGEPAEARARFEDLLRLYPSTTSTAKAAEQLEALSPNPTDAP